MPHYLLSMHAGHDDAASSMSEEEMQQSWADIEAVNQELRSAQAWVYGGALDEPASATVIRDSEGQVITTDGPFAEVKEQLAGFYLIEADDLSTAQEWARKTSAAVRRPIEVRTVRHGEAG